METINEAVFARNIVIHALGVENMKRIVTDGKYWILVMY